MIKKLIVLLAGMLVTVAVYAAGAQLRRDTPTLTPCAMATRCGTSRPVPGQALAMAGDLAGQSAGAQPASIYPGDVLNLSFHRRSAPDPAATCTR